MFSILRQRWIPKFRQIAKVDFPVHACLLRGVSFLACISHQLPTAADDASYPEVFSHLGVLNVQ